MIRTKTEIIQLLATKYNLPLREISKIVDSQFSVLAATMASQKYESVRLPLFGVFKVRPGITGLAQVAGITMETPTLLAKTDLKMIKQMNLFYYFYYILITILLIFKRKL